MRPSSGGRTPPFLIVGFLVVIGILAFNYWNISSKNSMLTMTVNQLELKYRSTQANKLDVEKRNVELSAQLEEAKRYKQEAQDKDMKLREAEQKAAELNGKIDTLASDLEVAQNDLNVCEDSVGFCHQNITKMTIDHKRELEEAHMQCNRKVDEAKSLAEQRAASLERPEQNQQLAQQNAQAQQDVRAVQQQQAPQQQYHQLEQQEREQQKQPEENQIQPQQQPAENQIQQQQQPAENQIEQQQQQPAENQIEEQQQPVKHEPEQPQLQNNLLEYHQQQQYPNLQHVSEEHLPHLQPALPAEQGQAMTQQQKQVEPHNAAAAQQQQQAQPTAQQLPHESLQNVEQQHEKPNETMMEDKNKEVTVNPGLSQSDDLIKAAQQGYPQTKQNPEDQHQDQASDFHKPENQLSVINQAPVAQQGIDEAVRSSDSRQKIYDAQKQDAADHDHVGAQIVSQHGEPAPAPPGELIVNRQVEDGQEQHPVSDQKRDQEDYVARGLDDAAPLGQADEHSSEVPRFYQYSEDGSHPPNDDDISEAAIQQIPQEPVQV